jgi:hypothetical protein
MSLDDPALSVRTREDLAGLLSALAEDYAANHEGWANGDLAAFLGAMAGFADDIDGYYANRGEDAGKVSPWRMMADILMAGRVYE